MKYHVSCKKKKKSREEKKASLDLLMKQLCQDKIASLNVGSVKEAFAIF